MRLYDLHMGRTRAVMLAKNHDYNEAWRKMRVSSYTDMILMKLMRTKEIEGVDANYQDIINYSIFGLIKLAEQKEGK